MITSKFFSAYRLGNLNFLLLSLYSQLLDASLLSLAMQSLLLQKFWTGCSFPNSKEMVLLVLPFHFLVLWLCRMFLATLYINSDSFLFISLCSLLLALSTCYRHNLFLHSALVLSRKIPRSVRGIKVILYLQ